MTRSDIAARVRGFITSNFYVASPEALSDEVSLLDQGLVDSTGVLEIIEFIEESFSVKVADDEMIPDNLGSIALIAAFVERKSQG